MVVIVTVSNLYFARLNMDMSVVNSVSNLITTTIPDRLIGDTQSNNTVIQAATK